MRVAASYSGQWDRVQLRSSNFMGYTLEERVALILLELSGSFGDRDRQGVGLMMALRHQDLADLVGASRPRVTEYLASFEGKSLLARDGRRLIVMRGRAARLAAGPLKPLRQLILKVTDCR
jgi:CRP-like cAMP-binding protein